MAEEKDEITRLLEEYQQQRTTKRESRDIDAPLPPPIRREDVIDFAKNDDDSQEEERQKKKKERKSPEERAQIRAKAVADIKKYVKTAYVFIKKIAKNKKVLIGAGSVLAVVGVICAIVVIVGASKTAYLRPYEKKYDVEFPEGILEEYCDFYGENQQTVGAIEIGEAEMKLPVYSKLSKQFPMAEDVRKGASQANFVVYLDSNELEKQYSTADGYNSSSAEVHYSDLFNKYDFRVIGAFYTNISIFDDNNYVFPYNTTEKMTPDSASSFGERLGSRFLYDTGITITRADRLIMISCPTDYRENFRFVLVGIERDLSSAKPVATEKSKVHFPQVIYDEKKQTNPYRFSCGWYPEIELTDESGIAQPYKTTVEDYQFRHPVFN